MYCSNCGTKIPDDETRFCPKCGKPIFSSPNEYGSKLLLALMVLVAVGFLAYIFLSKNSYSAVNKAEVSVKLQKKNTEVNTRKQEQAKLNVNLPDGSLNTGVGVKPQNKVKEKIASSVSGFRHSLSITNSHNFKGKVIKAKLYLDGQSKEEALNTFASFFAACYGNKEFNTAYAVITLLKPGNKKLMTMGIGRVPASSIPTGTWQRFDKMGAQLRSWVLAKQSQYKGSGVGACFYFEAK